MNVTVAKITASDRLFAGALAGLTLGFLALVETSGALDQRWFATHVWFLFGVSFGLVWALLPTLCRALSTLFRKFFLEGAPPSDGRGGALLFLVGAASLAILELASRPSAQRLERRFDALNAYLPVSWITLAGFAACALFAWLVAAKTVAPGPKGRCVFSGVLALAITGALLFFWSRFAQAMLPLPLTTRAAAVVALWGAALAWVHLGRRVPRNVALALCALLLLTATAWLPSLRPRDFDVQGHVFTRALATPWFPASKSDATERGQALVREYFGRVRSGSSEELDRLVPTRRDLSVLWITLCTVRKDRLGTYGGTRDLTPHFDAFARSAQVFERAYTPFPASALAMYSMFSGNYPRSTARYRQMLDKNAGPDATWAPSLFKASGRNTWALTALGTTMLAGDFAGLLDGFEIQNPYPHILSPKGSVIAGATTKLLREQPSERPFFAWVHLMDAHAPYEGDPEGPTLGSEATDLYDGDVRVTDRAVGSILEALSASSWAKKTVVVIHADHGEEFQEHGGNWHYTSMYEEQVAIPLAIHVPGLPPGRNASPVDVTDLVPTLAEVLDLPPPTGQGDSLVPLLLNGEQGAYAYGELLLPHEPAATRRMVVGNDALKLIVRGPWEARELYDLRGDPLERRNLAGLGDPREDDLFELLAALREGARTHAFATVLPGPEPPDPVIADRELLREVLAQATPPEDYLRKALEELPRLGTQKDGETALRWCHHPDATIRRLALEGAHGASTELLRDAALAALLDPDATVRRAAAHAMARCGSTDDAARLPLDPELTGAELFERAKTRAALGDVTGITELRERIAELEPTARAQLLVFLAERGDAEALDTLRAALESEDAALDFSLLATRTLLQIPDAGAMTFYEKLLSRQDLPEALLLLGLEALPAERKSLPALLPAAISSHPRVRYHAWRRLLEIAPQSDVRRLVHTWQDHDAEPLARDGSRQFLERFGLFLASTDVRQASTAEVTLQAIEVPFLGLLRTLNLPVRGHVTVKGALPVHLSLVASWHREGQDLGRRARADVLLTTASSQFLLGLPRLKDEDPLPTHVRVGLADASGEVSWLGEPTSLPR